jgi:long-subunit fatty acid transport protein
MSPRSLAALLALLPGGTAFAGSISTAGYLAGPDSGPATADPAAIVFNPAAMGGVDGVDAMLDVQANFIRIEATTTRNGGIDPNTGEAYDPAVAEVMVPNAFVGVVGEVWADRLNLGLGVNTPFVGGGDYSGNETDPPPYTSHQRYAGITVRVITIAVTPALSFTPVEGVHLGGSFSYVRDSISALQASDPLGTEGYSASTGPYSTDSLLEAEASGHHLGWGAGLFVDKFEKAQLGVGYSAGGTFRAEGTGSVFMPSIFGSEEATLPAVTSFEQPLPAILRAGLSSTLNEKLELGAIWEYQMWNQCCGGTDGDLVITVTDEDGAALISPIGTEVATTQYSPRRLWNSSNFAAFTGFSPMDKLYLGLRGGYQQNAVPDFAVSATNLDFQSVGTMVAARYKVAGPVELGLSYTRFFLFERTITNSAWGVPEGEANYRDDRFSPVLPYKANTNGTYAGRDHVLGLRVKMDL